MIVANDAPTASSTVLLSELWGDWPELGFVLSANAFGCGWGFDIGGGGAT